MKLGTDYLKTGRFEPAWTDEFGSGPLAELKLQIAFAGVRERRTSLLDENGEPKSDKEVRDYYCGKVVGWNVEDAEFSREGLDRLLDLEPKLEGWIVNEVNSAARFLGQPGDAAAAEA